MKQTIKVALNSDRINVGRFGPETFTHGAKKELNGSAWIVVDKRNIFDNPEYNIEYDPKTSKLTVYKEIEVDV